MFQTEIFQQYFGREERKVEKSNGWEISTMFYNGKIRKTVD